MKRIILLAIAFSTVLVSCKKDDNGKSDDDSGFDGSIQDIEDFYSSDIVDALDNLDFDINTGNNPPNIEGVYFVSPSILQASSVPGDTPGIQFPDITMNFSNQDSDNLTIDFTGDSGPEVYDGDGSFISGDNNRFSVFLIINVTSGGQTAETTFAISGQLGDDGIENVQVAVLMLDDNGDPGDYFIENNTGRVLYDEDGFSPEI